MQHSSAAAKLIRQMFRQDSHHNMQDKMQVWLHRMQLSWQLWCKMLVLLHHMQLAALQQNAGFAAPHVGVAPHAAFITVLQQNAGLAAQKAVVTAVLLRNALRFCGFGR